MTIDKVKIGLVVIIMALVSYIYIQHNITTPVKTKVIVKTVEVKGEIVKSIGVVRKFKKDSIVYRKGQVIYTNNPIDIKLAEDFKRLQQENDSLNVFKKYIDAIQIKNQTTYFDDKNITIEVESKVRGELLEVHPKYTIKPQIIKTEVEIRKPILALYVGAGVSNNRELNNFITQAEAGVQVKDKNIISLTFDTKQNIGLKYLIKL